MYSPSCLLDESATPAEMARSDQLAAIITPLVVVIVVAALWLVRFGLFNFRQIAGGQTGQEVRKGSSRGAGGRPLTLGSLQALRHQ